MEPLGYLVLAAVAYLGIKMFSGSSGLAPMFTGQTDPNTGAKLIDSSAKFMGPQQDIPRIPATPIANGQYWCPYPFVLYKDAKDGKFYCYNEAQLPTTSVALGGATLKDTSSNVLPSYVLDLPSATVTADAPTFATTNSPLPDTLTAPDFVQAGSTTDDMPSPVEFNPLAGGISV